MQRRTFITALFATAAVAIAEPAQAIRGFGRGRRRRIGRMFRGNGVRTGRRISRSRSTRYQNVFYSGGSSRSQTISSGVSRPAPEARRRKTRRKSAVSEPQPIDRNQSEFWRSPGEIDRTIVAKMQPKDIQGMSRTDLTRKYGMPRVDEGSSMTWDVGRTSDGVIAPQTFTVRVDTYGKATSFQRGF
ncbi:MAG: hypothetical protein NW224_12015 [Leptolyngbyaceae cyanobacterium bins.302]|nr:hypothetical protein [Leptolyngbyaceae cyanobacterium bins.302]